jgi:hypothetical protein
MTNPFFRRATEYIFDDAAFLSIVSPQPLKLLLDEWRGDTPYFDILARIIGNPGSGKTMMASLVEFRLVEHVLRNAKDRTLSEVADVLSHCGFTDGKLPLIAAARLPMEAEYRDFWELPYDEKIKTRLVFSLIQARCIVGLVRNLTANNRRELSDIRLVLKDRAHAQIDKIGGDKITEIYSHARAVEAAIYEIGAGLFPPEIDDIPQIAKEPYQPFEAVCAVEIDWDGCPVTLKPMFILDDVHTLHPEQIKYLFRLLAKREINVGRWLMMRNDALSPNALLGKDDDFIGYKVGRDFLDINFQKTSNRETERKVFRKIAADMAARYIKKVPVLRDRNHDALGPLLLEDVAELSTSKMKKLEELIDKEQRELGIALTRRHKIEALVEGYVKSATSGDLPKEVRLGMVRVLQQRYFKRISQPGLALFGELDHDPRQKLKANSTVADAARIFLHDQFQRPLHFGLQTVCDASNENAELFLQLAGSLVHLMQSRVVRRQPAALSPELQQRTLQEAATQIIEKWQFPYVDDVRRLVESMAQDCLTDTHVPNAKNGAGTNAIAIPEDEFSKMDGGSRLALVLKYALAYGAIVTVKDYPQGKKEWRLVELSGLVCLRYGLTLKRGGFIQSHLRDFSKRIEA